MKLLKQSTAVTVKVGPFVDSGDAVTFETSLTIQKADVKLSKNGGTYAAANSDQGASDVGAAYDANGDYEISLNTTDTGTLGRLKVSIAESGALPVWDEFLIVPANVWNSLVGGTDLLDVNANEIGTDAIDADSLAADAVAEITSGLALASAVSDLQTTADEILSDTGLSIPVAIAALPTAAQVNAEVVDAIATDTYAEPAAVPAATSSLKDKINWLFALARNKRTQTATTKTLRNDADNASIATATVSDDATTATHGEWS